MIVVLVGEKVKDERRAVNLRVFKMEISFNTVRGIKVSAITSRQPTTVKGVLGDCETACHPVISVRVSPADATINLATKSERVSAVKAESSINGVTKTVKGVPTVAGAKSAA